VGLKFIPQAGVDELGGGIAPAHLGVEIDLGVEVFPQARGEAGPHQGEVLSRGLGLPREGAAPLAQAGSKAPAAVTELVLIKDKGSGFIA
jgi:hypothetical protein